MELDDQEASCSQSLILLGDLNHTDVCGESLMAGSKQSRRLLESIEDKFLFHVLNQPEEKCYWTWCSPMQKELIKEVETGGSLGCSDHALDGQRI